MTRLSLRRKHAPRAKVRLSGYTLTEMLVVIAIIGVIAAVVIPETIGQLGKAQSRAAKLKLQSIAAALELYQGDTGRYPTAQEGVQALLTQPEGVQNWTGPYLHGKDQLSDPWGHPYRYAVTATGVSVTTLGADNKDGGDGADKDITVSVP
jgi:general secretion pathway protein G